MNIHTKAQIQVTGIFTIVIIAGVLFMWLAGPVAHSTEEVMMSQTTAEKLAVYRSHKLVNATPMTMKEYNDYRAWPMPYGENPDEDGYLVEYLDGGKVNDPRHKSYISWTPKDVFDRNYTKLEEGEGG